MKNITQDFGTLYHPTTALVFYQNDERNKDTYVEHFAIDPAARNGGIGAEAMKQFLVFCGTPVVLEVEMPTDEMSKRRIGFYERLGFKLDNQVYHQPPYREGGEWLEMRLMTYGDVDLEYSFEQVKNCLHKNVYGVKDGLTR